MTLLKRAFSLLALPLTAFLLTALPLSASPLTATIYDVWYDGRRTACGQRYNHWGISAAHATIPCGTHVLVAHRGRSLVVPITDRCACSSIDLSGGAARRLNVIGRGTVSMTVR